MALLEWKDIPGFEGLYQVSNLGIVRRLGGTPKCRNTRYLKPSPVKDDVHYSSVGLCRDGKAKSFAIHQLVALAFIGPPGDLWVNHINGIKTDNRLENLEYLTPGGNTQHAYDNDLQPSRVGSGNGYAKLDEDKVWEIRMIAALCINDMGGREELARSLGISKTCISDILTGKSWSHVEAYP